MTPILTTPPTPRLFSAPMAAAYLSLGVRTFEYKWRSFVLPQPHRIGRRLLWDRKLLDLYVDALSDLLPEPPVKRRRGWDPL